MVLGWTLLALAVALTASLTFSMTRTLIEEHRVLRRPRPSRPEPRADRIRRLGRVVIEPIIGR